MRWQKRSRKEDKARPRQAEQKHETVKSGLEQSEHYLYWNSIQPEEPPK